MATSSVAGRGRAWLPAVAGGLAVLLTLAVVPQAHAQGIVVESVETGSSAEAAGLLAGDHIVSWSQAAAGGEVRTPFDLVDVAGERAPRGSVVFSVTRGEAAGLSISLGESLEWNVVGAATTSAFPAWGIHARPTLLPELLSKLESARQAQTGGASEKAAEILADAARSGARPEDRSWLHLQSGDAWRDAGQREAAQREYELALGGLAPRDAATLWTKRGEAYRDGLLDSDTTRAYAEAERLLESAGGSSVRLAETLRRGLGKMAAANRGKLRRAAEILEELAPDSLLLSKVWTAEAILDHYWGEPEQAELRIRAAHAIQLRNAPGTAMEAASLMDMGVFASKRGDFGAAELYLRQATTVMEGIGHPSGVYAGTLMNLGSALMQRGEFDAAEDAFQRALEADKSLPWNTSVRTPLLTSLGDLALERGNAAAAESFYQQARDFVEATSPDSIGLGEPLRRLGTLLLKRGDLDGAERAFEQTRALEATLPATTVNVSETLMALADVARARGDSTKAESLYQEVARGHAALRPGSFRAADALSRIASLRVDAGRLPEAAALYAQVVDVLERQRKHLGTGQERGSARMSDYTALYGQYAEVLLALGKPEEAFRVVEASRGRALVDLLAQRDLGFARDMTPELAGERRRIKHDYDRVLADLEGDRARSDSDTAARLSVQLRDLQAERLLVAARVRQASPGLAEIEDPPALSVAAARRALDPGTVLLSYLVGERKTLLFALQPEAVQSAAGGLATFEIAVGREELNRQVDAFLSLVHDRSAEPTEISAAGESLYRLLVAPAAPWMSASSRILVSPDGPLLTLPFAALVEPGLAGKPPRFLAEHRPIHVIGSATVYAELRRRRALPTKAGVSIAAFGDPVYPRGQRAETEALVRSAVRGRELSPLPGTRTEVRAIASLFSKETRTFLGKDATEENAKSLPRNTRYVHFACHTLLNARSPLDSALVLSLPETFVEGHENGILQAWEIFEDVRIDAEVVTLSACESGLGTDVGGEGLVGLTRAFQYAGAHSVLASLWSVADDSTAELMALFYRSLKAGKPKDQALQEAQIAMIHRGYPPFHWAAFQLTGDWR